MIGFFREDPEKEEATIVTKELSASSCPDSALTVTDPSVFKAVVGFASVTLGVDKSGEDSRFATLYMGSKQQQDKKRICSPAIFVMGVKMFVNHSSRWLKGDNGVTAGP